ncbi:TPA: Mitogen-activated protein kinase kinase kinase kinase [Trebouxia sp. C0004]
MLGTSQSMATVNELVEKGDIPEERKDNVKRVLHDLGYAANRPVGKAFLKITKKDMTDAGMSIADANAILAEVEPVQVSGPGRLTYDELYSKLSQTKGHVDSKVLSHMIRFFAAEILLANQDILSDLYDSAKASPLSSTKASLREDEGLIFNGAFVAGTPSRAVLLIAFENGAMPVLCKFTAEQQAVVHEFEVLELLWQEPAVPRIVGPVKLLKANPAGRSHGHVAAPGGPALRVKQCLQMPVYPATLQHIPAPMKESVILTFGRQLKTSLQHVHQKGYGHNDVKAANIFISAAGECILGDFGSALELGKHSHEHTPTHWPVEFEDPDVSVHETSIAIDFFQLAVTLLERTGHLDLTDYPTTTKCRDAIAKLQSMEVTTFIQGLLQPQVLEY